MNFLLDENFPGEHARDFLKKHPGSVWAHKDSRFQGKSDEEIYKALCGGRWLLISYDSDFSNKVNFPPEPTAGIVVIRMAGMKFNHAYRKLLMFLSATPSRNLKGTLTILKKSSVRTRRFR